MIKSLLTNDSAIFVKHFEKGRKLNIEDKLMDEYRHIVNKLFPNLNIEAMRLLILSCHLFH